MKSSTIASLLCILGIVAACSTQLYPAIEHQGQQNHDKGLANYQSHNGLSEFTSFVENNKPGAPVTIARK